MFATREGGTFDPYRPRSHGVLGDAELEFCRDHGIPVGYDCAQIGWVALLGEDDIATSRTPDHDRTMPVLVRALGERLADLVAAVSDGRSSIDEARRRAIDHVATLAGDAGTDRDAVTLDRFHTVMTREVMRFLPVPPSTHQPSVDAARIGYRPWSADDLDAYRRILGNERVWRHLPERLPEPMTDELAEHMLELSNHGDHHDVVAVVVDDEIVGQVRLLFNQDYPGLRAAEITYLLGEEHWGRGLMTAILADVSERVLAERQLDFLCAWIHPANIASVRCAERAGYLRDAFGREAELATAVDRAGFERYKRYARPRRPVG